jgi:predicted small secreted protein
MQKGISHDQESFAVASIAIAASACNTVKGAGRDIESVGKAGDEAIN